MSYYQEILEKINEVKLKNPHLAYSYIEEELNMPYVEKELQKALLALKQEVKGLLPQTQKEVDLSKLLFDEQLVVGGLDYLRNHNVHQELEVVEQFLCSDMPNLYKGLMILILIDQGVYQELKMKKDFFEIEFSPNQIELPYENEVIIRMSEKINEDLMQHPTLIQACNDELFQIAIENLPFTFEESEIDSILNNLYSKVLTMYGEISLLKKINTCNK